jgi:hypothetical protein
LLCKFTNNKKISHKKEDMDFIPNINRKIVALHPQNNKRFLIEKLYIVTHFLCFISLPENASPTGTRNTSKTNISASRQTTWETSQKARFSSTHTWMITRKR